MHKTRNMEYKIVFGKAYILQSVTFFDDNDVKNRIG